MIVTFLTEGGKQKGFGHISRCVSIADAFRKVCPEVNICFIIDGDNSVDGFFSDYENVTITKWTENYIQTNKNIEISDIIIVDSYYVKEDFCEKLMSSDKEIVFIDDFNRINYPGNSTIVNGAIGSKYLSYSLKPGQKLLTGINYAFLRKEFWKAPQKITRSEIKTVLISMGGTDIRNMTPAIIENLKKYEFKKTVFVTDAMSNISEIKHAADEHTKLIHNPTPKTIKIEMQKADIGIVAAGQILFETATMGLPCITVQVIENQTYNVEFWSDQKIIRHAGKFDSPDLLKKIDSNLQNLKCKKTRAKITEKSQNIVDGKGSERIVKSLLKSLYQKSLVIRPATIDDELSTFNLSNQRSVRENSYDNKDINLNNHKKWFAGVLKSENEILLVGIINDRLAGQVRFSGEKSDFTVGISVDEKFRGFGIAKKLLVDGCSFIKNNYPKVNTINAYVKSENLASIKLFKSANFEIVGQMKIKGSNSVKFILKK